MGDNKASKPRKDEVLVRIVPPVDPAFMRWLARDIDRIHGFPPTNPCAIKPPEHCIQFMRHQGWLDLNLDDPDLTHLFK